MKPRDTIEYIAAGALLGLWVVTGGFLAVQVIIARLGLLDRYTSLEWAAGAAGVTVVAAAILALRRIVLPTGSAD